MIRNVETVGPSDKTEQVTRVENVQRNFFKEEELRMQVSRGIRSDQVPNIFVCSDFNGLLNFCTVEFKVELHFSTISQITRTLKSLKNTLKLVGRICKTRLISLS